MIRKKELIQKVTRNTGQPQQVVRAIIESVFDTICDTVASHEDVHIVNFGTLKAKKRAERVGRDPNTGKQLTLPEMYHPVFLASTQLKNRVKGQS